tara:strand:+ start:3356 stop:4798 length:1443 start_codon:yes stop_codon:yes gene_type:complete
MKNYLYISICICALFTLGSCDDEFLSVNDNPGIPSADNMSEILMLPGIEAQWSYEGIGNNSKLSLYHLGQRTLMLRDPENEINGFMSPGGHDLAWSRIYQGALANARRLVNMAEMNGNSAYKGIGQLIEAVHWALIVDNYNDAPYTEALQYPDNITPIFDKGEDIYVGIQGLVDQAITNLQSPKNEVLPGSEDLIFKGNLDKWLKLAYSLKARYAMRLTYAPGYTKTGQADIVLAALNNGMESNDDDALLPHSSADNELNYYYQNIIDMSLENRMVPAYLIIEEMNALDDPRRAKLFDLSNFGDYRGYINDGPNPTDMMDYSLVSLSYLRADRPTVYMDYAEVSFLKAEAYVLKGEWVNAEMALKDGIRADMEDLGVEEGDITTYLAGISMPADEESGQALVMLQKWMANYVENYEIRYDFLRTGYPAFDFVTNNPNVVVGAENTIPQRLAYPASDIDKNPNFPEILVNPLVDKVFWDAK